MDFPSAGALLDEARRATGLSDFGDARFREGLEVVVETCATTARLSERGVRRQHRYLVEQLSIRLRCIDALARRPEVRRRPIRGPLLLVGLPRSGTSALFGLLAADPAARPLRLWETRAPWPLEGHDPALPDPRHVALREHFAAERAKSPEFDRVHHTDADAPEECVLLLASSFESAFQGVEVLLEPYASWVRQRDPRPAYRYYLDLLRLLDWQRPGERWLLKSPYHLFAIDTLCELLPDAGFVMTHRDPVEVVASYCSMIELLARLRGFGGLERPGEAVLEFVAVMVERGMAARDRHPERFVDLPYERLVADGPAAVREIYERRALPLPPAVEAAIASTARQSPRGAHGTHDYRLEDYGLTPAQVRERMSAYIERFAPAVAGRE